VLAALVAAPGESRAELLALAAALQQGSEHPLARAVSAAANADGIAAPAASDIAALPGRGLRGTVDGRLLLLGSTRLLLERGIDAGALAADASAREAGGQTVSWLIAERASAATGADRADDAGRAGGVDDAEPAADSGRADGTDAPGAPRVLALLAFGDALKPAAAAALARLVALGIEPVMVTGDNPGAAAGVARALGITSVRAQVLPEGKAAVVAQLKADGAIVAMVGDGINDAPALAAADVGFAMATGTDVAMESAGITLMRGDPHLIADAIDISRRTWRKIRQNLFWAFVYNVVGIPLAALGLLSPVVAGAAMAASSVSVVSNARLLARWRPAPRTPGARP